ncbi:MAG: type II toxin-antitoxin system RelE/ParE family toxin [Nitrospirae bacterium]|jgi:toxin HigB-1|nr:type II toxin-antitoxin system RelE/ParE family toxin [Nitrospirota bacterium]
MIKSFSDRDTEVLYLTGKSKKFPIAVCKIGIRKLDYLNAARTLKDLIVPPGNRIEALKGKYEGKYSIRINDQYRIVFKWHDPDAFEVEITDYH